MLLVVCYPGVLYCTTYTLKCVQGETCRDHRQVVRRPRVGCLQYLARVDLRRPGLLPRVRLCNAASPPVLYTELEAARLPHCWTPSASSRRGQSSDSVHQSVSGRAVVRLMHCKPRASRRRSGLQQKTVFTTPGQATRIDWSTAGLSNPKTGAVSRERPSRCLLDHSPSLYTVRLSAC